MLGLGNAELSAVQPIRLLAGAIGNAHEYFALIVLHGRNDEPWARLRFGVDVVREVAPDDVACSGLRPPVHQALSTSKRLLRTVAPLAMGAVFLS
jgi:hypothetical protein